MEFDPRITRLDRDAVLFPVRHHSPAAARLVEEAIARVRPRAVLIEGPSDFNDQWEELGRGHRLPIAIYSYVVRGDDSRQSAFYPFCAYSPEWRAIEVARERGIPAEFIDLPWLELSGLLLGVSHVFADGEERRASYTQELLEKAGLESFDDLWDVWFEIDGELSLEEYLERCHRLMFHIRASQPISVSDQRREAFMAARIEAALERHGAPVLAVTGAYHCPALFAGVGEVEAEPVDLPPVVQRGLALTPYSYERLDGLTGYDAGMPNPGFYHRVWRDRASAFESLLAAVATGIRARKQPVSAADLIAVDSMARGLAILRGQPGAWRRELADGIRGALIKDDLIDGRHPMLDVLNDVLRGDERGWLAAETKLPPLVHDIAAQTEAHDLRLDRAGRELRLDLTKPEQLGRARVLHRLRGLGIAGYELLKGGELARRDDVMQVVETWSLRWLPEFEASCIERAIYGATLEVASRAKLEELARQPSRSAAVAAEVLFEAALQGHLAMAAEFEAALSARIHEDGEFRSVAKAVNTLLYLYRYDDVLGAGRLRSSGSLLQQAYQRGLWLAEAFLNAAVPPGVPDGIALLRETLLRCGAALGLDQAEFAQVFTRLAAGAVSPALRGASAGVLWSLAALEAERIELPLAADPEELGDFLDGLFALARETVQRHPELVARIDTLLMSFSGDAFEEALPSLRLAFSRFAPREKHHIVRTLLGAPGAGPAIAVNADDAARALAWEARVFEALERHGILREEGA